MKKLILIIFCLPIILFGQTTSLFSEDFSSGLPADWYVANYGTCTDGFLLEDISTYQYGLDPSITGSFMVAESYNDLIGPCGQDVEIYTPAFDASLCDSVFVDWSMDFNPFATGNDVLRMYVWDGSVDNLLWEIDYALAGSYYDNITDYVTSTFTQVGFSYSGYDGLFFALDNVELTCLVNAPLVSWDCDGAGTCTDPGTGMGMYPTLATCNTACVVNSVEEQSISKRLIKITDLLGREVKGSNNEVLFYIYDDGSVEKRVVLE